MRNRNFIMVVAGQIISLFGNAVLRFALPLYLLNETGSAALFGIVSACAFVPMILLAPIGGIFADRVNKRNIMVTLDFLTAALVLAVVLLLGRVDVVVLIFAALFILYGIQGAYQPAVQASIPALLPSEYIMQGNAVINLVSSFSGLLGPVIGGTLFSFWGIEPVLYVSMVCFVLSAVMEIFIRIPFVPKESKGGIIATGIADLKESFFYMKDDQPLILKFSFAVAAINLTISALMIIGLPVIVTQLLDFGSSETASRLYGFAEGVMAVGSLCGGAGAGLLARKLKPEKGYLLLFYGTLPLIPIGLALMLPLSAYVSYGIIMVSCFVMMLLATLFSIQIMAYLQIIVPGSLIGKVISCAICIGMCATPLGQALYGSLFELLKGDAFWLFFVVAALDVMLALKLKKPFARLAELVRDSV